MNPRLGQKLLLGSIAALLALHTARAQTVRWGTVFDANGNVTTAPATTDWGTGTNWNTGSVPTSVNTAQIGQSLVNLTLDLNGGTFAVNALNIIPRRHDFGTGANVTINATGGGLLQIGTGGVTVNGGTGTTTIAAPIEVTANQIWTGGTNNPSGNATFNGAISGLGQITRTASNASIFTFAGANTFSGGFINSAQTTRLGSASTVAGGVITDGPLGRGTVTLNAGTLSSNGGTARTLFNNIVLGGTMNLGNSAQTGALTFSDGGLTTATTFTLASAANGNVSVLRAGGTNLTFDQVIAESGGARQSVLIAGTSGTPTVTINRTKTATGNILSGGVNLVLANGAAQAGALLGVNGSLTATGSNKFSSGALVSDAASLIASDAANYSAVADGKATVYNNGRASFATDQTQATLAGLFTSDSQLRLGLGSGSGSASVTENYNQSALGNGKAGLVSASSGTMTYNGTLTAGSDATYRVGGGAGTLALGTALTGSNSLLVEGGGTVTSTSNNSYNGATTVTGTTVTISGLAGALSATTAITLNAGTTLNLTNNTGAVNTARIGDTVGLTLNNSNFALNGTSTTAASETVGNLTFNAGRNFITVAQTPAAATVKTLQFGTVTRLNNALAVFRGDSLGGTGTARNEIRFSAAPTLIGGGGAAGSNNISIIPWARGGLGTGGATTFATYETNGVRVLTTAEFVQANNDTTARIDQAIATAGGASNYNVRAIPNTTGGATLVNTASSTVNLNALLIDNNGATGSNTYSLNSSTINVASGALHVQQTASQNLTIGTGTIAFGAAEGVITVNGNSFFQTNFGTQITGSGGLSIYAVNGGGVQLSGVTTSGFSGGLTIGGNGYVGVDQDGRFGAAANSVTHAGGALRFLSGFTTTRDLILLGNVGNNTLENNSTTAAMNWNGTISGSGLLRLVNSNATNFGFSLGGANNYSGGTQIEGINVSTTSNTALGTGTVTLLGANNFAAALTLSGAGTAPTLGGLRGTDGTVTITTTDAGNAATLSIGSNNESTVFNGVIAQAAGKTASLRKVGTGTLVLSGNSTYTGATDVNAGQLIVAGSLSGAVNVQNVNTADALLAGTGVVGDLVVKSGGGFAGTVDPGVAANAVGQLTANTIDLQTGAHLRLQLGGVTAGGGTLNNDRISLSATSGTSITLAGDLQGSLINGYAPAFGDVLFVLINNGPNAVSGAFSNAAEGAVFQVGGQDFQITYLANFTDLGAYGGSFTGGNDVALLAVPEPGSLVSLIGGLASLLGLQRFRRRT